MNQIRGFDPKSSSNLVSLTLVLSLQVMDIFQHASPSKPDPDVPPGERP